MDTCSGLIQVTDEAQWDFPISHHSYPWEYPVPAGNWVILFPAVGNSEALIDTRRIVVYKWGGRDTLHESC